MCSRSLLFLLWFLRWLPYFFGNTAALKAGKRERNKAFIRKAKAFPEALQLTSGYINISLTTLTARKS